MDLLQHGFLRQIHQLLFTLRVEHTHGGDAEPLLFGIPEDAPEFLEAKRLLKFLDYFLGVTSEDVPKNSVLREFVGGSVFPV